MQKKSWIWIFISILVLITFSSVYSLCKSDIYILDSEILRIKSNYLDIINICLIIPLGIIITIFILKRHYWAKLAAIGVSAYSLYMFGFNSLSLGFNELFLVYIAIFGLSIFCTVIGYKDVHEKAEDIKSNFKLKFSAIYLLLFATVPAIAWISEIVIAIMQDAQPSHNLLINVTVNVVHVFDLAFFLPVIIIFAINLLRGKYSGVVLSFISVIFVILISISILFMEIGLVCSELNYDEGQLYSMFVLIPLGIAPLITLFKEMNR